MKRIAIITCMIVGTAFGQTPDQAVRNFQAEVASWEGLTTNTDTPVSTLKDQHQRLLAAWKSLGDARSGSIDQAVASANRQLVRRLVESGSFEEAGQQIHSHAEFCSTNRIGLIGRSQGGFPEFVESHAMIMASLGRNPLADAVLPYELKTTDAGFLAIAEWKQSDGSRATEIHGDTVRDFPESETLGECVVLGKTGRLVSTWFVGLTYPGGDERLSQRLSSVYVLKEPGPGGAGGFIRKSTDLIRKIEMPKVPQLDPEAPALENVPREQSSGTETSRQSDAKSRYAVTAVMILAGVLGLLGFLLWRSRRAR